ncbi:uncharacterized protein LAJ45_10334 [Morchella importuna]|uniref:uncharacterized protein n=1 Tax=Morchella importuna TaxID=1174673 RepID=UPI001E8E49DB|nr:uncharacterized protein LAJ45_10334 [Morchella importuna]KAH8145694.1 hypothetical protein LAJ45_10334 [Morchella importuna]
MPAIITAETTWLNIFLCKVNSSLPVLMDTHIAFIISLRKQIKLTIFVVTFSSSTSSEDKEVSFPNSAQSCQHTPGAHSGTPSPNTGPAQGDISPEDGASKSITSAIASPTKHEDYISKLSREIEAIEEEFLKVSSYPDEDDSDSDLRKSIVLAHRHGRTLVDRFKVFEEAGDLEKATSDLEKAIERFSYVQSRPLCNGVPRQDLLWVLCNLLLRRYSQFHSLSDLDFAIQCMEESRGTIGLHSPNSPHVFRMLNSLYRRRFERSQAMQDLEKAEEVIESALEATNANHRMRASLLHMLSTTILKRYDQTQNKADLDLGIEREKEAISVALPQDPAREDIFRSMAAIYLIRADHLGQADDIEQAISWAEQAVGLPIVNNQVKAESIHILSTALLARFERKWDIDDVNRAINLAQEAIGLIPMYTWNQTNIFNTLGGLYLSRHRHTGDSQDLDKAIEIGEGALSRSSEEDPSRALYLTNITQLLFQRSTRYHNPEDLKEGTRRIIEILAVTPLDDPQRPRRCYILAAFYKMRYDNSGNLIDLNKAIELSEEALQLFPPTHISRFQVYNLLAKVYTLRYHRLEGVENIELSIEWARKTYSAIGSPRADRSAASMTLARSLMNRFKHKKKKDDILEARDVIERELCDTPPDFEPRKQSLHTVMAEVYRNLYDAYNDPADIEQSIKSMGVSLAARPMDAPDRAIGLYNRAIIVMCRYRNNPSSSDLHFILHDLYEAWNTPLARGMTRVTAATFASRLLITWRRWQEVYGLLDMVVRLLPVALDSRRSSIREDEEHKLAVIKELAPNFASVAFLLGEDASYGLRILELGRGVIIGSIIDRRSDLSVLLSKHPPLYAEYHRLRTVLDAPISEVNDSTLTDSEATVRYEKDRVGRENAVASFELTQASIREMPGFEGFQLPPRSEELMKMACDGPIIMVNSTTIRSDAIIVTTAYIRSLQLPKLEYAVVEERMAQLIQTVKGGPSTYNKRNEKMEELLLWLWESAVKPVMDILGFTLGGPLPRIWWIGIGPLAVAPFHAAGSHSPGSTQNTMSYAISSYIPTIKALSFARERSLRLKSGFRLLLVSMPTTPGHNQLPSAETEVTKIMDSIKGKANSTHLVHPGASQVLDSLPSFNAVHFSCHGISDAKTLRIVIYFSVKMKSLTDFLLRV